MQNYQLSLEFRGDRSYLHGTDIYRAVISKFSGGGSLTKFRMAFHGLLKKQPKLIVLDEFSYGYRKDDRFRGEFYWKTKTKEYYGVLLETTEEVLVRKPCNESEVVDGYHYDEVSRTVRLESPTYGTSIEQVVFLNKCLHGAGGAALGGAWLFAKLDLVDDLANIQPRYWEVSLKNVLGKSLTCSEIFSDKGMIGKIYFSPAS